MLQAIKRMEQQERWAEIRQQASVLLAGLEGDALARGYLATSKAFELTATTPADYRTALAHACASVASAVHGGLLYTWALHRVASLSADVGDFAGADRAGRSFLAALHNNPEAAVVAPWVYGALARSRSRLGAHGEAIYYARQAVAAGVGGAFQERVQIILARVLARAGHTSEALGALPDTTVNIPAEKLSAARALIAAVIRDWPAVMAEGRLALRSMAAQPVCDMVEVAELLLTLKRAAEALGLHSQAAVWLVHTAVLLSRWGAEVLFNLLSSLRGEGGAFFDAAASHRGGAGHKRTGLLGTLG